MINKTKAQIALEILDNLYKYQNPSRQAVEYWILKAIDDAHEAGKKMTGSRLYTCKDLAKELRISERAARTVALLSAKRYKIGRKIGCMWVFTRQEIASISGKYEDEKYK